MTPERHEFANDSESDSSMDSVSSSSSDEQSSVGPQRQQIYYKPQFKRPKKTLPLKIGVSLAKSALKS